MNGPGELFTVHLIDKATSRQWKISIFIADFIQSYQELVRYYRILEQVFRVLGHDGFEMRRIFSMLCYFIPIAIKL